MPHSIDSDDYKPNPLISSYEDVINKQDVLIGCLRDEIAALKAMNKTQAETIDNLLPDEPGQATEADPKDFQHPAYILYKRYPVL